MTALNVAQKILLANAAGGLTQLPEPGQPLEIQFTHTLYQDATGAPVGLAAIGPLRREAANNG